MVGIVAGSGRKMFQISENAGKLIKRMTAKHGLPQGACASASRPAVVPG